MSDFEKILLWTTLIGLLFVAFKFTFYKAQSKVVTSVAVEFNKVKASFWCFLGLVFLVVMLFFWAVYHLYLNLFT